MLMILLTSAFAILLLYLFCRKHSVRVDPKIPCPTPCYPLIGHLPFILRRGQETTKALSDYTSRQAQKYQKDGIMKILFGPKPIIFIFKPEIAQVVLNDKNCLAKPHDYEFLRPWLGRGLITSDVQQWKKNKKQLLPAFHPEVLRNFLPTVNKRAMAFVLDLTKYHGGDWFDVYPHIINAFIPITTETIMALPAESMSENFQPYLDSLDAVHRILSHRVFHPLLRSDAFFKLSSAGKEFNRHVQRMQQVTLLAVKNAKLLRKAGSNAHEKIRKSFMELILDISEMDQSMTEDEVREHVDTLYLAASDAPAVVSAWWTLLMGEHPTVQQKVYEEVISVCGIDLSAEISEEQLNRLDYLECSIKEVMRLYPPVGMFGRRSTKDIKVAGYIIPKECTLFVLSKPLHRDKDTYSDPDVFLPERWRNVNSSMNGAYVAFSMGSRSCIGQRFAMMMLKVVLAHWIRSCSINCQKRAEDMDVRVGVTVSPNEEVLVKLNGRH